MANVRYGSSTITLMGQECLAGRGITILGVNSQNGVGKLRYSLQFTRANKDSLSVTNLLRRIEARGQPGFMMEYRLSECQPSTARRRMPCVC